jgi:hypothetical protein
MYEALLAALQPGYTTSCEQSELTEIDIMRTTPIAIAIRRRPAASSVSPIPTIDPYHATLNAPPSTNNINIKTTPSTKKQSSTRATHTPKEKREQIRTHSGPIEPTCLPTFPIQASRKRTLLPGHDATSSSHTHICQRISEVK